MLVCMFCGHPQSSARQIHIPSKVVDTSVIETQEALLAQRDPEQRNRFIERHSGYICRCASRAAGRWIDRHDDIYSCALIAFNDAIDAYLPEKGSFPLFSSRIIRNRVIDSLRQEKRHAGAVVFSALSVRDERGNEIPFDAEDPSTASSDAALEIASLRQELDAFGISFFDLPAASPKSAKTKAACLQVIQYICVREEMLREVYQRQKLPAREILSAVRVNKKVLERHRKYIIAGILICTGGYTIMAEYFCAGKEETPL